MSEKKEDYKNQESDQTPKIASENTEFDEQLE